MNDLIVFLGPSLPAAEAKRIVKCELRPPARQGDLFRALNDRPSMIVLIDGVFEATPSVWHHEILAAHACGIEVLGASSMGALRAAELAPTGTMVGIGAIFRAYDLGELVDDAEVALLHASAEHQYRQLTVPLVNVRHAAERAIERGVLAPREARELVEVAGKIFYQERRWTSLLGKLSWSPSTMKRWERFAARGLPDLKADDARECLAAAKKRLRRPARPPSSRLFASNVRRRRLHEERSGAVLGSAVLDEAYKRSDLDERVKEGVRRKLVAAWARELGLTVSAAELQTEEARWLAQLGVAPDQREQLFAAMGLDESQARVFLEELALDAKAVGNVRWMISDAPSADEAIAFELRRRGLWARLAEQLS